MSPTFHNPAHTVQSVEISIDPQSESSFDIPSSDLTIPLIDATFSLASQLLPEVMHMKLIVILKAFMAATIASALWRRLFDFLCVYCSALKMPQVPHFILCFQTYRHPRIPLPLLPLQWLCLTFAKNVKACVTQGTLVWIIVFIDCLPESKSLMKSRACTNVILKMAPPVLLTIAQVVEITSLLLYRYMIVACVAAQLRFSNLRLANTSQGTPQF